MGLTTKEIGSSSFNDMISSVDRRSEYVENRAGANVTLNNFLTPYTLDNKSSILNAPCGYSNGMYASLRPVQTIGPELVTNGDFSNGTNNWTLDDASNGSISVVDGKLEIVSNGGAGYPVVKQGILTSIGKKYSVTFSVTNNTTGFWFRVSQFESHLSGDTTFYANDKTSSINFKGEFTAISTTSYLKIFAEQNDAGSFQIDNVSVKEVTDADFGFSRGSSATRVNEKGLIEDVQILSGELVQNGDFEQIGSELVTNGNFDNGLSGWSSHSGSTLELEDGKAKVTTVSAQGFIKRTDLSIQSGKTYFCKADITNATNPVFFINGTSNVLNPIPLISGNTYGGYITTTGNNSFFYIRGNNTDGEVSYIDNVSVKEVGQNWDVTDGWSIENGKANIDTSEGTGNFNQLGVLTVGKKYRLSLSAAMTVGSVKFQSDAAGVFIFSSDVSSHEFIASSTTVSFRRYDTTTSGYIDNVSVIEITDDTDIPRIDYTDGTGSLLLEPQSTNLVTYSEDFSNSYWQHNAGITVTSSSELAPDGKLNANLIEYDGSGYSFIRTSQGAPSTAVTISVFAKKGNWRYLGFRNFQASGNDHTVFDFDTQTFSNTASGQAASFEIFPNGWYKIKVTQPSPAASPFLGFSISNSTGSEADTTGGQVANVHLFGAQVEELSYATSYIPTSGSTVTRSADVANNSGNADLINSTEGVLYAEIAALANSGNKRRISLSDGTDSNGVILSLPEPDDRIKILIRSGGAVQVNSQSTVVITPTDFNKIAIKYKENDFALWVNGTEVFVDSSGLAPIGLNKLAFDFAGSNNFYGNVKALAVFKEALTDAELAQITSATQQEVFYEMRDRMLQINADYYEFGDYTTRLKKLF